MERLWLITNPGSGSTSQARCDGLKQVFADHGLTLEGVTDFPEQPLPDPVLLEQAGVDTVVLFAGDGTINAALATLGDWHGHVLVLPGGTMNLLCRALHGDAGVDAIVAAAREARYVAVPYVEAGGRFAWVGLILGPAAAWANAREAVRAGRIAKLARAARLAWGRTFRHRGVRVSGAPMLRDRYQAIYVTADTDGVDVAAIDARDWRSIARLGWDWLTGQWVASRAVTETHAAEIRLESSRPVLALFDGEPQMLEPGTRICARMSAPMFIATTPQP